MKTNTIRLTQKKPKKAVRIAQKKQTKIERLSKIMLIGTVLCCMAPFLYVMSMQMKASSSGITMMNLIETNPLVNLNMIAAFLNPFVGYMLFLTRKRLLAYENYESVYLNLAILMVAQICSMNILYLCLFAYVLYKAMDVYEKPFKSAFQVMSKSFVGKELGGSILIFCFFLLITLLTLRLNFLA